MLKLKEKNGRFPTHIFVGVGKSASSWIWKNFTYHPEVFTPATKEIHFFDNLNGNYFKGIDWYKNNFITNKKVILEVTPNYFNTNCLNLISTEISEVFILICLRNPIYRAFSSWKFDRFITGRKLNFIEFWNRNEGEVQTHGLYDEHLLTCMKKFKKEKVYLCFYDDIKKNPVKFLDNIFEFMKVQKIHHEVSNYRWMPGKELFWNKTGISNGDTKKRYDYYKNYFKNLKFSHEDWNILKNFYQKSILNLQDLVNRNLSSWLEYKKEEE